jgi:hypothetical protein
MFLHRSESDTLKFPKPADPSKSVRTKVTFFRKKNDLSRNLFDKGHVRKSWTFHPVQANGGVHLTFKNVDTERQFDLIRVYELGQNDELGALIRVIHGKTDSVSVSVNGSVYVSFVSAPQTIGGQGFQMNFSRF